MTITFGSSSPLPFETAAVFEGGASPSPAPSTSPFYASNRTEFGTVAGSPNELFDLKSVCLAVASVSLFCTVFSFYWFLRMRRSFRHE